MTRYEFQIWAIFLLLEADSLEVFNLIKSSQTWTRCESQFERGQTSFDPASQRSFLGGEFCAHRSKHGLLSSTVPWACHGQLLLVLIFSKDFCFIFWYTAFLITLQVCTCVSVRMCVSFVNNSLFFSFSQSLPAPLPWLFYFLNWFHSCKSELQ